MNRRSNSPQNEISIPMVGSLPIQLAIIEMMEVFVFLLYQKYNKPYIQGCQLKVKICTIGLNTGSDQAWFCVRIKCSNLADFEQSLGEILPGFGRSVLEIIQNMQKIFPGEFLWIERIDLKGDRTLVWHMVVEECNKFRKRTERKTGRAGAGLAQQETAICWKVVQSKEHMVSECEKICNYMHRLKLFTPMCSIQFYLNVWGVVSSSRFDWNCNRTSIGQRKMASDIEHFMPSEYRSRNVGKIFPKLGCAYTLSNMKGRTQEESIKITALSALIPQPPKEELGTRLLNTKCRQLKLLFYGPGGIPLILPSQQRSGLCPTTIIKLEEYGLAFGEMIQEDTSIQGVVNVDWCYKLKPVGEEWYDSLLDWDESKQQAPDHGYTILLVIFLEQAKSGKEWQAENNLHLVESLRQTLVHLLCKYRTKVRRTVASVLNKILQNLSKVDQKQELINKSIAVISSSVYNILARSDNQPFQQRCMTELNINSLPDARSAMSSNLWAIATERFGISAMQACSKQFCTIKTRKKRTLDKDNATEATKQQPDGFDDLAKAVEAADNLPSANKTQPTEDLEPFIFNRSSPSGGFVKLSDERSLAPRSRDDDQQSYLFQSLSKNAAGDNLCKKQKKSLVDNWDTLNNAVLVTSFGEEAAMLNPDEVTNNAHNTSVPRPSRHTQKQHTAVSGTSKMINSRSTSTLTLLKSTNVKDYMLPQIPDPEKSSTNSQDWVNEFSCWDS